MAAKTIKKQQPEAKQLRRAAVAFAVRVAPALEAKLAPFLEEGERMPDLSRLAVLAVRRVEWLLEHLEEADLIHQLADAVLDIARDRRRQAWAGLSSQLCHVRDMARAVRGKPGRVGPGLCQPVPHPPYALLRYAGYVCRSCGARGLRGASFPA